MRKWSLIISSSLLGLGVALSAGATDVALPAGPIHDRHELMEGIGKSAKALGEAAKAGDRAKAATAAASIQESAKKIPDLFPKGSTHPDSRAKPEIWESWDRFMELAKQLDAAAGNVVTVAEGEGELGATTGPLFATCKSCHDDFRVPEE